MQTNRRGSVVIVATRPNPTAYNDSTILKKKQKMGFRRTMRRWFGGRYKQMSKGEVRDLDRKITAEMHAGSFSAVRRGAQQVPTGDQLWKADAAEADEPSPGERLPSMSSASLGPRPPTSVSQVSRFNNNNNRYYHNDFFDDDYGGYQDGFGYGGGYGGGGGGGGGSSGDSGYAAGYYERPPLIPMSPPQPRTLPAWYVPGGGPFDMAEAKPESIYGGRGGSRTNSMMSNVTRGSRRPSAPGQQQGNGYYTPPGRRPLGGNRAYSMQSDPGRMVYARSPQPRRPYVTAAPSWDGHYYDGDEMGPGYEGGGRGRGGGYAYRGWAGEDIGEHEYPLDNDDFYEDYPHPRS